MFVGLLWDTKHDAVNMTKMDFPLWLRSWELGLCCFLIGTGRIVRRKILSGPSISFWDQLAIVRIKRAYENFGSVAP
jgi:hypothetical protein